MSAHQTIWREGNRIRQTDGLGYSDRVTDDEIRQHIADNEAMERAKGLAHDPTFRPFAEAVLAIRAFERATEVS